ncbi:MAG TPA: hypothetical protein VK098_03655 [Beutenbergiaceae bacterium]|nr:hypothetical protein [Beutenbergiaceae bacterium]
MATHLGEHVRRIPDGEVGKRFHWILFQGEVFDDTPGLARVGEEPVIMAGFDIRPFAPDGTVPHEEIEFPELGYAEAALNSYEDFTRLREEGMIGEGIRFQVSLPTPLAPLSTFVHPDARPLVERAYTSALVDEINEIASQIPAADLAIQFDLAVEFSYIETAAGREVAIPSHAWFEPLLDGLITRAAAVIEAVPAEVDVGLHLCYGDVGEKHFVEPLDTANLTTVANAIAADVTRPLNWLHLPVPIERDDREYFAPLGELADAYQELYLGLIHHQDGADGAHARIDAAKRAGITDFGVATECGFGRGPAERTVPLLQLHAAVADPLPTPQID